ncbi:quinone oxidoreductase [Roseovarius sp. CAU 1744]|uniref:quinone oxidoreductase family protein n=1 Tax=Roseovarius sp. CAU 1744 TaxID=3140368 RepID=UPI00325B739A
MTKAIRISEKGGPDVMKAVDVEVGAPGEGEALIRHTAIGVNMVDVYHRSDTEGQYAIPVPNTLGVEAAGVVEAVGSGVEGIKVGDRVAYCMVLGAYCEKRLIPAEKLVKLPEYITDEIAAACMIQGLTAQYLLHSSYKVTAESTILIHAAAGGVGLIMCQWARDIGATVIGTVGTSAKGELAMENGCDHVIYYREEDFVARVKEITGGAGVDVVYDSVGLDTFSKSLECLRPLGTIVNFGQASGAVPPLDISLLAKSGSVFLAKPTLATYVAQSDQMREMARNLFDKINSGAIKINVSQSVPLGDIVQLHRDMADRKTVGSVLLKP